MEKNRLETCEAPGKCEYPKCAHGFFKKDVFCEAGIIQFFKEGRRQPCTHCDGTGKVSVQYLNISGFPATYTCSCPTCQ